MATHSNNTPSGVIATGLPSRRAALASLAGLGAAIGLPALATAAPATAADPAVAELAALYADAHARYVAAGEAVWEAYERYVRPAPPEVLFEQESDPLHKVHFRAVKDLAGRPWFGSEDRIDLLRDWPVESMQKSTTGFYTAALARRAEILAAYDGWQVAIKVSRAVAGIDTANAARDVAWAAEKAIRFRILDLRSAAPEVLRLKLRIVLDDAEVEDWRDDLDHQVQYGVKDEGGPWQSAFSASIIRDLATAYMVGAS